MTKLTSKEVKTFLKEQGYNTKGISVKIDFSGCADLYIKVILKTEEHQQNKNNLYKLLTKKYDDISHCPASGEILNGGNTAVIMY